MSSNLEVICQHIQWHQIGTELLPVQTHIEVRRELLTVASGDGFAYQEVKHRLTSAFYARFIPRRDFPCHKCKRMFFRQQIAWCDNTSYIFMCHTCHAHTLWGVRWDKQPIQR